MLEKVKNYLDFASKHNFDGLLVEGWNKGWYPEWCCRGDEFPLVLLKHLMILI